VHWSKQSEKYPVTSTIQLPTGTAAAIPRIQSAKKGADVERLRAIKEAAKHAWSGYRKFGWGYDEVRPVSGQGKNSFNGWGATLVDSLDTLWIMGLQDDFEDAVNQTSYIDFTTSPRNDIPLFEVTIRYLGGLIAAYDVSGQKYRVLLDKAVELAEILYSAFDTPNRMPETYYYWKPQFSSNNHRASTRVVLAELGTLSLEFTRLAQLTKEPKYYDAIARITNAFEEWQNQTRLPGMWPISVDASGCAKPVVLAPSKSSTQFPVPGGDTWMLTSPPLQAGVDAAHKAEKVLNSASRHTQDFTGDPSEDVPNLKQASAELDSFTEDVTDAAYVKLKKRQLDIDTAEGEDPDLVASGLHTSGVAPAREEPECVPQGLRSPSMNSMETFTMGGQSDSVYEYLPKEYLLLGGRVEQYRTMYLDSMEPTIEKLIFRPMTAENLDILISGELTISKNYTTDEWYETHIAKAEHLTCFTGGMLAMGGKIFNKPEHVEIGRKLTDGCIWSYNSTASGIMPESFVATACESKTDCQWNETLWHEKLDPYKAYREEQRATWVEQYGEQALLSWTTPSPAPFPSKAQTKYESLVYPDTGHPNINTKSGDLRRYKDESSFGTVEGAKAAVSHPLSEEEMQSKDTSSFGGLRKRGPDVPVQPAAPKPQDPHEVSAPIYTPAPPPTHEEFVKQKIEDERLPPGFARYDSRKYILRPEAIESVFYMYRITGEQHWREAGWEMFKAVERHTRVEFGHSALDDVSKTHPEHLDGMESFWLAETLKYFYLLFDDEERWSLDDWVLNTEAHFFRRAG
ncbi:glycoside hydrolase family 47 protein, partial [Cercospora zeae-maydis SCOH1-5]